MIDKNVQTQRIRVPTATNDAYSTAVVTAPESGFLAWTSRRHTRLTVAVSQFRRRSIDQSFPFAAALGRTWCVESPYLNIFIIDNIVDSCHKTKSMSWHGWTGQYHVDWPRHMKLLHLETNSAKTMEQRETGLQLSSLHLQLTPISKTPSVGNRTKATNPTKSTRRQLPSQN